MSTLYIDRKNLELRIESNTLAFYSEGRRTATMPLNIIERICIKSDLTLTASALGKLGEHGIGIIVLSGRRQHPALLMPNARQDALRRIAQAHYSRETDFCLKRAREWIAEKIRRQHRHLIKRAAEPQIARNALHHETARLEQHCKSAARAQSIATLRGIEGSAANTYFAALAKYLPQSHNFTGRNRNPPRDPVNVVLSLSYTLIHFETVRQIHLTGLDPCIGYYHSLRHSRESLACDLMEPLRPHIDEWTIDQFKNKTLRPEDFGTQGKNCRLGKAGRARYYPAYETAARQWRRDIRAQTADLLSKLGEAALNNPQTRGNFPPEIFDPQELICLRNEDPQA